MRRARITGLVLAACALVACDRCSGEGVAELLESDGVIERNVAGEEAWSSALIGQRFELGDAARTGESSTARLRVGERGGVRMQPRTVLRFLGERPDHGARVRLETGEVELESEGAMDLETELGAVTLQSGARVVVRGGADGARVQVIAGRVVFDEAGAQERVVEAGTSIVLAVGRVVFEDDPPVVGAPPDLDVDTAAPLDPSAEREPENDPTPELTDATEPTSDDVADDEPDADGAPEVAGANVEESPARAHLAIPAGESPTIHDPGSAPTAVRLAFDPACAGRAVVAVRSGRRTKRWAGEGSAIILVPTGRSVYSIDCPSGPDARGAILVRRDDGSTRLQSVAPRNVVDGDGRTYDVLYQNALPILTMRWREADGAAVLHVRTNGRERTFVAPGARLELRSGELGEGTHRFWFTVGARRSPETTLRIRFDNAAPAAMIREPSSRTPLTPGASVQVSGAVLPDTQVRAAQNALSIDPQHRFAAEVVVPTDTDALAVRFSHRRRGVHYYLRRVGP